MNTNPNTERQLLERKRQIDAERKAQAILKARVEAQPPHIAAMRSMFGAPIRRAATS